MNVLIVDDQVNVISGVKFGVHWDKLGVSQVYKAYNAYEAKRVLSEKEVDIMLCDIEMPMENGLKLLNWVREQKIQLECIFLTAHADFLYAKEAIALGSFDYILQPARYEEIEDAIRRASRKIAARKKMNETSRYGKFLTEKKNLILDAILNTLFSGDAGDVENALKNLAQLDISVTEQSYLCLIDVVSWGKDLKSWDLPLLYDTIQNVVTELFFPYGQDVLLFQKSRETYYFILYSAEGAEINPESLKQQLEQLKSVFGKFFSCGLALYFAKTEKILQLKETVALLQHASLDNVEKREGIYDEMTFKSEGQEKEAAFCSDWEILFQNELYDDIIKDAQNTLHTLSIENRLNANALKRFYQEIMRVTYRMADRNKLPMDNFFSDEESLQRSLTAYASTEDTLWLVKYIAARFNELRMSDTKRETQVDEIFQYIRSHINEDIKRSDIADAVHLNPNYISSLFKSKVGVSLKEYIITEKMTLAKQMVQKTNLPISVIAMKVGYVNFSHFSQSYKKLNGVSPTEDRESASS